MSLSGKFYGVDKIGQNFLINQLEINMKSFLEWGFLNAGGFINVHRSTNNINSTPLYRLYSIEDPNYNNGQVWQTVRKDWVYESGVSVDGLSPVDISGIYIGNNYYDTSTVGTYQYKLDYKNGRIIFNSKIPTSSNVSMNYSYKWIQIYNYADAEWWQELQYSSNQNPSHFQQKNTGDFTIDPKHRVQLPSVVIETVPRGSASPFRLGDKSLRIDQDFILHVVAQNYSDRNNITDIIRYQQDKVLPFYNVDKVVNNNVYPFNFDGSLNPNRIQYNGLINSAEYIWRTCRLKNMIVSEVESLNADLFECKIRTTAEIIFIA